MNKTPNYFLQAFVCILCCCLGLYYEYSYGVLENITVYKEPIEETTYTDNATYTYDTNILNEKIVKYYEVTEEDIYNVIRRFVKEANFKYTKNPSEEYVSEVAMAYTKQLQYVPNPEITFYTIAMGKKESKFDITARPPKSTNSSAEGIGQIIWRWHKDKLSKEQPWREPITRDMLTQDICASIDAKYIVFENYLINNKFNYKKASNAYLGLNQKESAKRQYRLEILADYHLLTQRLFRLVLEKELKEKVVYTNISGETIVETPVTKDLKINKNT